MEPSNSETWVSAARSAGRLARSTAKPWFIETISTLPVVRSFTGRLAPWWPCFHLDGRRAQRQGQHLVAEADAEHRHLAVQQLADHRHGILAGGGRVAGAVGEKDAVGLAAPGCPRPRVVAGTTVALAAGDGEQGRRMLRLTP